MSAGIFARVIAPQEFALGLSQLGTDAVFGRKWDQQNVI
jgi:hypothetical protein